MSLVVRNPRTSGFLEQQSSQGPQNHLPQVGDITIRYAAHKPFDTCICLANYVFLLKLHVSGICSENSLS